MRDKVRTAGLPFALMALIALLPAAAGARSEQPVSSDLLLPNFQVDLSTGSPTTLLTVGNAAQGNVEIKIELFTNWGVSVLEVPLTLDPGEVRPFNLATWLRDGKLPEETLSAEDIAHLQAALTGGQSPQTGLYYSAPQQPERAVGYAVVRTQTFRPRVLYGDFFVVDPSEDFAKGETLVDIDERRCTSVCRIHGLRFLEGGAFDGGTEIVFWTGGTNLPSTVADPGRGYLQAQVFAYAEDGRVIGSWFLNLLATEKLDVAQLMPPEPFGWLEIRTRQDAFLGVRYDADDRYSVGMESWYWDCGQSGDGPPKIDLEKFTNGVGADDPPGPSLTMGDPVTWEYLVTNTGGEPLAEIAVSDDREGAISCPETELEPGESMTCTAQGFAEVCDYKNLATVFGTAPDGEVVDDEDPSRYTATVDASIDVEKQTRIGAIGDDPAGPWFDADAVDDPRPEPIIGNPIEWRYVVTNTGAVTLFDVLVTDSEGVAVSCPSGNPIPDLAPGASVTCTASGEAINGLYENEGVATASTGYECPAEVRDSDLSHYQGGPPFICFPDLEKHTWGVDGVWYDADDPTGPPIPLGAAVEWRYIVSWACDTAGGPSWENISVTDDRGVAVSCPQTSLEPGESMTCTGSGIAEACQYANLGTATGTRSDNGAELTADDPSHYFGEVHPAIDLEKHTNGHDADVGPGPELAVGDPVLWEYFVTNTGDVTLVDVAVVDNRQGAASCPTDSLAPGGSMTCTLTGTAQEGEYGNLGTVTASSAETCGPDVSDSDASHYHTPTPCEADVDIEKATNGHDADFGPGPAIAPGDAVTWTYVVTNTGDETLHSVAVEDNLEGAVSCPQSTLEPGESMTCTLTGVAGCEPYENTGTVVATACDGVTVSDFDLSHYTPEVEASIDLEKATNGHDADFGPGPEIAPGDPVTWTYVVTNTGAVELSDIAVSDDREGAVSCPSTSLAPGASMTCSLRGVAGCEPYENTGTVTAASVCDLEVSASDDSHHHPPAPADASIDIEKHTNGHDADVGPGPNIPFGAPVLWEYFVTNTGGMRLENVVVTDDQGVAVSCPASVLDAGQSMTCAGHGDAVLGPYENLGTVTATGAGACSQPEVSDRDPSHYDGYLEREGCTPGYWKNHTDSWPPTGYSPGQTVMSVFAEAAAYPAEASSSLLEALDFGGGETVEGGARILLRAAVAGVLNASHDGVGYPWTEGALIASVDAALASGDRATMIDLAAGIDADNNAGCPLN